MKNLPAGISIEENLHGSSDCETFRASENGNLVIVKTPDRGEGLLRDLQFDDSSEENLVHRQFVAEKHREQKAAEASAYFLDGRMERQEESLFWVRPYMARSLKEKVLLKEKPDGAELGAICRSIAKALAELDRIDQFGHGNLRLSNVLLSSADADTLKLVDLREGDSRHAASDKRALGLIIYQLVNGEFVEFDERLSSVPSDQDWRALGPASEKWREFCSELLDPYGRYADAEWDAIASELKALSVGTGGKFRYCMAAVVLLLGAVGCVLFFKFRSGEEALVVDLNTIQGQWLELLDEYFQWGGAYLRSMSDFEEADEHPEFVDRFYDVKKASVPTVIIGKVSGQGGVKIQNSPKTVYQAARQVDVLALSESEQRQIVLAHQLLKKIRGAIEEWPVLTELRESRAAFAAAGFEFGVSKTDRLLDGISFTDGTLTVSRLHGLQSSVQELNELQGLYDTFNSYQSRFEQVLNSEFLGFYAGRLRERLQGSTSEDPVGYLREQVVEATETWKFWTEKSPTLARELFQKAERNLLSRPGFVVSNRSLVEWKDLVSDYQNINLQALNQARETFRAEGGEIRKYTTEINEILKHEPGAQLVRFDQEYDQLIESFESELAGLPLIAKNRAQIESTVNTRLTQLKQLTNNVQERWSELDFDVAVELEKMAAQPTKLHQALKSVWGEYLQREILVLNPQSFPDNLDGRREFNRIRREHRARQERFISFGDEHLARVPRQLPEALQTKVLPDLLPAVESIRREYLEQILVSWVNEATPLLLEADGSGRLEALSQRYVSRMRDYENDLIDYVELLEAGLNSVRDWVDPGSGFASLWEQLHGTAMRAEWSGSAFTDQIGALEVFSGLSQNLELAELQSLVMDEENPGFARLLAMKKIAGQKQLNFETVTRLTAPVQVLKAGIPDERKLEFESTLKSIWAVAFENEISNLNRREEVLALAEVYGVKSSDLSGPSRVYFELSSALDLLRANETKYLESPNLLAEVLNTLSSLPESGSVSILDDVVSELREVELKVVDDIFQNAVFLEKGWKVTRETDQQLVVGWKNHQIEFNLVEAGDGNFFLSEQECSIDLFDDWMTENKLWDPLAKHLPREWEIFLSERYSAIDDYRLGMRIWTISRQGLSGSGIQASNTWYVVDPSVLDEFSRVEPDFCPPSALNERLPMQHVGARLAREFAESMGMSLPTPSQWKQVSQVESGSGGLFWQERLNSELSNDLAREIRLGSFYSEREIARTGDGVARPQLLARVDAGAGTGLLHLAGNVAEYLYDPESEKYFISGGSALASVAGSWNELHPITRRMERTAFSDVGLRLALIAPEQSAYDQYIRIFEAYWK